MAPFISIVIPVFENEKGVRKTVSNLLKQTYPRELFEILVINNSASPLSPIAGCTVVSEPVPGSYRARNAGVAHSRGELLAFTDSDCQPEQEWLEKAAIYFQTDETLGALAGRVAPVLSGETRSAITLYESACSFDQQRHVKDWNFGCTANLIIRRNTWKEVGPFEEKLFSAADFEWGQRLQKSRWKLTYASDVRVEHDGRKSLSQLTAQHRRLLGGFYSLRMQSTYFWSAPISWMMLRLHALFPSPRGLWRHVFSSSLAAKEKGKVLGICLFIAAVRLQEYLRLSHGKQAER